MLSERRVIRENVSFVTFFREELIESRTNIKQESEKLIDTVIDKLSRRRHGVQGDEK